MSAAPPAAARSNSAYGHAIVGRPGCSAIAVTAGRHVEDQLDAHQASVTRIISKQIVI